ncbi:MAG: YVTN family beta-propeller repeat protein [Mucilaginibacter sp.]
MNKLLLVLSLICNFVYLSFHAGAQNSQNLTNGQLTTPAVFPGIGCIYSWVNNTPAIGLAASGTGNIPAFTVINTGGSPLVATISATPAPSGLLYVANQNSQSLSVISIATGTVINTIPLPFAPSGASVSPNGNQVYLPDRGSSMIGIYNTVTNTRTTVASDANPSGVAFSANNETAYVSSAGTNSVSVWNAVWNQLTTSINVGSGPQGVFLSPDETLLYVPNYLSNNVSVISTASNTVISTIPVGSNPVSLVFSPDGSKVYVVNYNSQSVDVINTATASVIATIVVGDRPNSIAISPDGSRVYVTNQFLNTLQVINTVSGTIVATIAVGSNPSGVAVTPDGNQVYVSNANSGNVSIINANNNTLTSTVATGSNPVISANSVTSACSSLPITFTITVNPSSLSPVISANAATGVISACVGSPSTSPDIEKFTVSGSGLTSAISATAPAGFEVSLAPGSGYGSQVTVTPVGGTVNSTIVYVRSAATASGNISGNVILSSSNTADQSVAVKGVVSTLPGLNTVPNQTVANGATIGPVNFTGTSNTFHWSNSAPGIGLPASGIGNIAAFTAVNNGSNPVVATITTTPMSASYAYITNSNDNSVSVVDIQTRQVVAVIGVGLAPQGVAVSPDGTRVYVANSGSDNISVIDALTNSVIALIQVGSNPIGITINADGSRVYSVNQAGASVSVINTASNTVVGTLPAGIRPFVATLSPDGKFLYVADTFPNIISVINTGTGTLVSSIKTGSFPDGVTISPDGSRLYVANSESNSVSVINASTGTLLATVATGAYPETPAISPDGTVLYVVSRGTNTVEVINAMTNALVQAIPVGSSPIGISISPDGSTAYVTNAGSNTVSIISTATNTVTGTVPVGNYPTSIGGDFITYGTGCSGVPVSFTITVNAAAPMIIAGPLTGQISACSGLPSTTPNIQQFSVAGSGLTGNITAVAPTGFEISLSPGSGYSNSITFVQTKGQVAVTNVYVRSAASDPVGIMTGNVTLTSMGATSQTLAVTATINPSLIINSVPNQTVNNGAFTTAISFTGSATAAFDWVNDQPGIGMPASGSGDIAAFKAVNTGGSTITATITATPVPAVFAYVANAGANTVSVIKTSTNAIVATIPVGTQPEGVCVSADGTRVYVSNTGSNSVSVINTATNAVVSSIPVGPGLYGITVSPDGSSVYVISGANSSVYVINTATNTVVANIQVGSVPLAVCVSPDGSKVYVSNHVSNSISVISTASNTVVATITVGYGPEGIVLSPDGSLLYVANMTSNTISVINTGTNTVTATILAGFAPFGITASLDGKWIYFTNNSNAGNGSVSVISTASNMITSVTEVGVQPEAVSVSPDGKLLFVTNSGSNTVSIVDVIKNAVIGTVSVGLDPVSFGNSFITPGLGCSGAPTTFTITVNTGSSVITASPVTGQISACNGSPSVSPFIEQFLVSGTGLSAGITATAPPGFEVSLAPGSGYGNSITISQLSGAANHVNVYVRSAAKAPIGTMSGNIVLASTGVTNLNVAVTGTVKALPTVNTVPNQIVNSGTATTAINFTGEGNNLYNWSNTAPGIGLPAVGTGNIASFKAINSTGSTITATITATPVAAPFAYITNSVEKTVSVINTATNTVVVTIPVGTYPSSIAISPDGSHVYVTNEAQNVITIINTATNTVTGTIPLSSNSYSICLSPDGLKLYATIQALGIVLVYDTSTNSIVSTIGVGTSPMGVATSPDGSRLYVVNSIDNNISVINTFSNTVIANVNTGAGPWDIKVSPDGTRIYVSTYQSNTISVLDAVTNSLITDVPVGQQPFALAISPDGSRIYSANTFPNTISVVSTATNSVIGTIPVSPTPTGLSVSPDGNRLYVVDGKSNNVLVIDVMTNQIISTITVGTNPTELGNFITPGTGCSGSPITFTITVNPSISPQISYTGTLLPLTTIYGSPSQTTTFRVSGTTLSSGILVKSPQGFEVSTNNINFSSTLTIGTGGTVASTIIYVRLTSTTPVGNYSGNIDLSSSGATQVEVSSASGSVTPAPLTITFQSANKTYGSVLTGGPGFANFSSTGLQNNETIGSITISYSRGSASNDAPNTYTGSITASAATGGTFTPGNYTITYVPADIIVDKATLTVTADNKTKAFGAENPVLTATYTGFVNNEQPAQLTALPELSTTATTTSPVGDYAIIVSGGSSPDYTIIPVNGILTVISTMAIPNAFTPNGDGINDVWDIKSLSDYPQCRVSVFTRYGTLVYQSRGYPKPWDGTFKGSQLPAGTYYYIINLQDGSSPIAGPVTILR